MATVLLRPSLQADRLGNPGLHSNRSTRPNNLRLHFYRDRPLRRAELSRIGGGLLARLFSVLESSLSARLAITRTRHLELRWLSQLDDLAQRESARASENASHEGNS